MTDDPIEREQERGQQPEQEREHAAPQPRWMAPSLLVAAAVMVVLVVLLV